MTDDDRDRAQPAVSRQADPVFERDVFLINPRSAYAARCQITDEQGNPILYVLRPTRLLRNSAAMALGLVAASAIGFLALLMGESFGRDTPAGLLLTVASVPGGIAAFLVVAVTLSARSRAAICRDEHGRQELAVIRRESKLQLITWSWTIADKDDHVLARLRRNMLYDLLRRRWQVVSPDGAVLAVATETSMPRALLRLATDVEIRSGDGGGVIGEMNRRKTVLDRFGLDLTADGQRALDRRIAVSLGVMLGNGDD